MQTNYIIASTYNISGTGLVVDRGLILQTMHCKKKSVEFN